MTATVLIAEDHDLARKKLVELLRDVDWIDCVAEVEDGPAALRAIDRLKPDLLFLDVRMPGMTGLEVLRRSTCRPHVIFTTAYPDHAVEAFELQALDYLLKPFGRERLDQALDRARQAIGSTQPPLQLERIRDALEPREHLSRIFVRKRGKILPIAVVDVERLEADADYVGVWTGGRRYLVRIALDALAVRLDPQVFCRIHRSHVVNLDFVKAMQPYDGSRLLVELRDGTQIVASRSRSRDLRHRIGIPG